MENYIVCFKLDACFCACEKQDISVFTTDDSRNLFSKGDEVYLRDVPRNITGIRWLLPSPLLKASVKSVVLAATVRTMGKVADYDRPFKVVVDQRRYDSYRGRTLRD